MIVTICRGNSSQDAAAIRRFVSIIQSRLQDHPAAVISTIVRATNKLEQSADRAVIGKVSAALALTARVFEQLRREFFAARS